MNATEENHIENSINMIRIAIAVFQERVASRLESAKHLLLVTVENEKIRSRELVPLREEDPLRKIDVIFELKPDIVICGGLTNVCDYKLRHSNIKIISWVQGNVEYILSLCLNNAFIQGHYDESKNESSYRSHS
jgi:predicted Fe-Mo cluster-binding NifX family protein